MCDPISMIGMGLSIGMSAINYSSQQSMMRQQESANNQWLSYQKQKIAEENRRQEEARMKAEASRTGTLDEMTAGKQEDARATEEQRLAEKLTPADLPTDPALVGDKLLSGQGGTDNRVAQRMSDSITQASQEARKRIAALAAVQSYGPSQFSLTNRAEKLFGQSAGDIGLQGNIRRGSLAAYGAEKQVQPIHYSMQDSGLGNLAGSLAGLAGQRAGGKLAGGSTWS